MSVVVAKDDVAMQNATRVEVMRSGRSGRGRIRRRGLIWYCKRLRKAPRHWSANRSRSLWRELAQSAKALRPRRSPTVLRLILFVLRFQSGLPCITRSDDRSAPLVGQAMGACPRAASCRTSYAISSGFITFSHGETIHRSDRDRRLLRYRVKAEPRPQSWMRARSLASATSRPSPMAIVSTLRPCASTR